MKNLTYILLLICSITICSCGQTTSEAIKHNDTMVTDESKIISLEGNLVNAINTNENHDSVSAKYNTYVSFLDSCKTKYEEMDAFDKEDLFRKEMQTFVQTFHSIANKEYKRILEIYMKNADELSINDMKEWDDIFNKIDSSENAAVMSFLEAQKHFAEQYGFELTVK